MAGLIYEKEHKRCNEAFTLTSKRFSSTMNETVRRQERENYIPKRLRKMVVSAVP